MARKRMKKPVGSRKVNTEANQYDKVFKEAMRAALPALLTDILQMPEGTFEPVHIEFQRTLERKTDFAGRFIVEGQSDTIVQLEAQTSNDSKMAHRLHLYAGLILYQYPEYEIDQIVFFLGRERPTMPTRLQRKGLDFRFRLVWIKEIPYRNFLDSGKPELALLAILADHGNQPAEVVMEEVVNELRRLAVQDSDRALHLQQLHILSNLHNLQQIFYSIMQSISEIIDERKDPYFQRGEKIGMEKGMEKGIEKGMEKGVIASVERIILRFPHLNDAEVADIFQLSVERVAAIRKALTEKGGTEKPNS